MNYKNARINVIHHKSECSLLGIWYICKGTEVKLVMIYTYMYLPLQLYLDFTFTYLLLGMLQIEDCIVENDSIDWNIFLFVR